MPIKYCWLVGLIVFFSCGKKEKPPVEQLVVDLQSQVLVLNEGNFNAGNASIDLYNPNTKTIQSNVFETANQRPLGDVLQSAKLINGNLWLVLNNSGKIEVIDTATFKSIKVITGLRSPRYLHEVDGKVYVTDLYAEKIAVISLNTYTIEGFINEGGWVEQIEGVNNKEFFYLNVDSNYIKRYDMVANSSSKINVSGKPFDLFTTQTEVFGGYYSNDTLIIHNLSKNTQRVLPKVLNANPSQMVYHGNSNTWYIKIGDDIMKVNASNQLQKIFTLSSGSLYALELIGDELFLSNAKDYVNNSELIRIDLTGKEIARQATGRITNGFMRF